MIADIYWKANNLSFGKDDPHFETENEGLHATLLITKDNRQFFLKVPEAQYDSETIKVLEEIKRKINQE